MKTKLIEVGRVSVAGVQYSDYQKCKSIKAGQKVKLFWEKKNHYDPNAIRVDLNGIKLGYVPKGEFQDLLHEYLGMGIKVTTEIVAFNPTNPTWHMITMKFSAPKDIRFSEGSEGSFD